MMNAKSKFRSAEIPFVISYLCLWFFIYLASRFTFEMIEIKSTFGLLKWVAIGVSPVVIYATLRTGFAAKVKWYGFVGYLVGYSALLIFATEYMFIQSNLLWDAAFNGQNFTQVKILEVHKVFKRKSGFHHTEVTILRNGQARKMEARPYAYFYLKDKKQLDMKIGDSAMGVYVTAVRSTFADKTVARWIHLKDMIYRMRWFIGVIIFISAAALIKPGYFPDKAGIAKKKASFWQQIGLVMAVLFSLSLLFYAGLWIYIKFFVSR
ncbi:hypothetical protein SAMN05421827_102162 [Pedobacter terrae]|uniref:Uncharacterized protein n=1 Tax=Pedobacter terrae TaxID=405671 RepID=A0A1G7Q3V8_9SPHI|nr:hypothetical protein [Pedobacter terrae]SDF93277.1 hypothetical protein SAMN05421827_102162 [Pedobacter terrae]